MAEAARKPEKHEDTQPEKKKIPKKKKKAFGPGTLAILIFVCLVIGVMGYRIYKLKQKEADIAQQIEELELQKADETERSEELDTLQDYINSDEYKKDVAHNKLGLANDNEIIFKESEE